MFFFCNCVLLMFFIWMKKCFGNVFFFCYSKCVITVLITMRIFAIASEAELSKKTINYSTFFLEVILSAYFIKRKLSDRKFVDRLAYSRRNWCHLPKRRPSLLSSSSLSPDYSISMSQLNQTPSFLIWFTIVSKYILGCWVGYTWFAAAASSFHQHHLRCLKQ